MPAKQFPDLNSFELSFQHSSAEFVVCEINDLANISTGYDRYDNQWDFEVWLPSRGKNLQRGLCWTSFQKEQLIWSLIRRRQIPPVAICEIEVDGKNVRQVIDGKQRIHAIAEFLNDGFPIYWEGHPFYCSELKTQKKVNRFLGWRPLFGHLAHDLTEDQKVEWFLQINFAGTPQDEEHCRSLQSLDFSVSDRELYEMAEIEDKANCPISAGLPFSTEMLRGE